MLNNNNKLPNLKIYYKIAPNNTFFILCLKNIKEKYYSKYLCVAVFKNV